MNKFFYGAGVLFSTALLIESVYVLFNEPKKKEILMCVLVRLGMVNPKKKSIVRKKLMQRRFD